MENELINIIDGLAQLENDDCVPKNVRIRIKCAMDALNEKERVLSLRISKSLQELEYVSEDPNVPDYIRTQIWQVVSLLESKK